MKHLVLVRHGESEWNVERRIQGQAGTGLSSRGVEQARRTAAHLASSFPVTALYTSDLERCEQTAALVAAAVGVDPEPVKGLRERDFGRWTGKLVTEVAEEDPEIWERWRAGHDVVGELDGEGTDVFAPRVLETLEHVLDATADGTTAVCVTHGGPVWHGTRGLLDLPERSLSGVSNASVTEIVCDDSAWGRRLLTWNQLAHLPPELRSGVVTAQLERPRDDQGPPTGT